MNNFFDWFFVCENRAIDGLFSRPHLFTVTFVLVHLLLLGFFLGRKYKGNTKAIDIILKVSAVLMIVMYISEITNDFFEVFYEEHIDPNTKEGVHEMLYKIVNCPPLYLCDIAIFGIPIIAFTKGRFRSIIADFMAIWGLPMGIIGTYLAGNVFYDVPVISFEGLLAIFIHVIPAAVTVFLYITGIASLKKENALFATMSFLIFMTISLVYDHIFYVPYKTNFMFFFTGNGTPFDLFRPYVSLPVYQIIVYTLYTAYMVLFYVIFFAIKKKVVARRATALAV
jgi:hypothetical protein